MQQELKRVALHGLRRSDGFHNISCTWIVLVYVLKYALNFIISVHSVEYRTTRLENSTVCWSFVIPVIGRALA